MKDFLKHKFVNYIGFVLVAFYLECLCFAFMRMGFFPTYFYLDLTLFMILGIPIFFFKGTMFDRIYLPILMTAFTFVFLVNCNYYLDTGNVFSIQSWSMTEGVDPEIFNHVKWYTVIIDLISLGIYIAAVLFYNIKFKYDTDFKRLDVRVITALSIGFFCCAYPLNIYLTSFFESGIRRNLTIDYPSYASNYNMKTLGVFSFYLKEATFIFGGSTTNNEQLKSYYLNAKQEQNEFTGLLKGKNVISIMIESGDRFMVNKYTTPTLYSFLENGVDCAINYNKHMTGISEQVGILGNYYTTNKSDISNIEMPFSLPNMIKDKYDTIYAHDFGHKHDLYNREQNIPKFGFNKHYYHDEIFPDKPEWSWRGYYYFDSRSSERIINLLKNDRTPGKPLYLHYTTMTMHYPYIDEKGNHNYITDLKTKYQSKLNTIKNNSQWINPLEGSSYNYYADEVDIYMMKCMDFDVALNNLITYVTDEGELDNTLFVLYGDHDCYGNTKDNKYFLSQLLRNNPDDYDHIKLFNTVLGFSNPTLNAKVREKYGSNKYPKFTNIDCIVPTVLDLLGIKYSPKFYYVDSLFSKSYGENNVMYSSSLSKFMNLHYRSDNGINIGRVYDDNKSRNNFINSCNEHIVRQINIDSIYKNNTFLHYKMRDFIPTT